MRSIILSLAALGTMTAATPALAQTFSGPYVGVQLGLDNYEGQDTDLFVTGDEYDGISGNGAVGGVYAGYDIPLGDTMFAGVEVNASLSGAKATHDNTVDSLTVRAKETYGASARLGAMLNDSTGLYAKAGWANTRFKYNFNGFKDSSHENALVLGGGLETRVGANASIRLEYNYADYDDVIKNNQIKAGVAFRF
ncbi:porin family protein [Parasphingorhabdus sp. JC815]|uniref:outer membrane protein n=1 Tax=Parasphingorhabdus sp. JC815 TaxID=3232140 RepID=UPI00345A19E0